MMFGVNQKNKLNNIIYLNNDNYILLKIMKYYIMF